MRELSLPPLFSELPLSGAADPFQKAGIEAMKGCDAGLVVHNLAPDTLRAAIVFAPEVELADAVAMLPVAGVAFQNALGALAPPEVAVHLAWDGGLLVNGATCGRLRLAASTDDPDGIPAWLIVGLSLPLWPENDEPGATPDQTALYAEGCADVDAAELLEAWVRHLLFGINRWIEDGVEPLHREWRGLAHGTGEEATFSGLTGTFLGVDERFGMLLRDESTTHLIPLTRLLEER